MSRRTHGRHVAAIVAIMAALVFGLVACGDDGVEGGGGNGDSGRTVALRARPSGDVTISNWPLYIDRRTIPEFERATGVSVRYIEDVNDNSEFFGKMQPL